MLMIVGAFANMEPKNLVMDHINITFLVITIWCLILLTLKESLYVAHLFPWRSKIIFITTTSQI